MPGAAGLLKGIFGKQQGTTAGPFARLAVMSARAPLAESTASGRFRSALAQAHLGQAAALAALQAVLVDAVAAGDLPGTLRSAGACLVTGQDLGVFRGFPALLAHLAPLRGSSIAWADPADELVAWAGFVAGLNYYGPGDRQRFASRRGVAGARR
jgi:hypothetical protein